ncbi:MAG: hypothetical protein H8D23_34455 [Candidatus Brocadiales bacterium]|nr:hypothetical protein [Candidatus Brocadiales bacterium]
MPNDIEKNCANVELVGFVAGCNKRNICTGAGEGHRLYDTMDTHLIDSLGLDTTRKQKWSKQWKWNGKLVTTR